MARGDIMLLQFKVKNFASFAEEACLDMRATNIKEHDYALLSVNEKSKQKVLPVAVIFGANAAGKTNFIRALQVFSYIVRNSVDLDSSNDKENKLSLPISPFLFDLETLKNITEFYINFVIADTEFSYEITCDHQHIYYESLKSREYASGVFATIFEKKLGSKVNVKKNKAIEILKIKKAEIAFTDSMLKNDTDLLLTALGRRGIEPFRRIYKWFERIDNIGSFKLAKEYICNEGSYIKRLYDDASEKRNYLNFLKKADPFIYDIGLEPAKKENEHKPVYTFKVNNSENTIKTPVSFGSEGTLRVFLLYPDLHRVLEEGGILVADELSAGVHPYLLQYIVSLFQNEESNPHKAQLIFNLHNPTILSNRYLRRDEVWFVEKDKDGKSELYSLVDIRDDDGLRIRNDVDFGKWYLLGRFGAVPDTSDWEV